MTYDEYNAAVDALEAPKGLDLFAILDWQAVEIKKLRAKLSKHDLLRVLQDLRDWQAKVDSSLKD